MRRTPMYECHVAAGGTMVDFGGWELPVQYPLGIKEEHLTCRNKAGLFDVSHMGEVSVIGADAEKWINSLVTNDISTLVDGQVQYNVMCRENGGVVDDLLVYRYNTSKYMLVINAANVEKDWAWFNEHLKGDVTIRNLSMETAEVALQGPNAEDILCKIAEGFDPKAIEFFHFVDGFKVAGIPAIVSRTGYTGEDGFEIYVAWDKGAELWNAVLAAGEEFGLTPVGLGARDSLRFEAGLPLCGQEFTDDLGPLEAGYGFAVKPFKECEFIGQKVLQEQKNNGLKRKILFTKMVDKGVPRHGMPVQNAEGQVIGEVTTGGYAPSLDANIASVVIDASQAPEVGGNLYIDIRGKAKKVEVVKKPYYKKSYKK